MRTSIIYAPHPDDETLYLGSYITTCATRGDRLVLVAATDGGSSGSRPTAWTTAELMTVRRIEQQAAWRRLTNGLGLPIIRIGSIDSADPNLRAKITAQALDLQAQYETDSSVEHYAACNNGKAQGVDHDAVALGLRDALVPVKRFANRCTDIANASLYKPVAGDALVDMQEADECFIFGHLSVPTFWQSLRDSGYTNRIVT